MSFESRGFYQCRAADVVLYLETWILILPEMLASKGNIKMFQPPQPWKQSHSANATREIECLKISRDISETNEKRQAPARRNSLTPLVAEGGIEPPTLGYES